MGPMAAKQSGGISSSFMKNKYVRGTELCAIGTYILVKCWVHELIRRTLTNFKAINHTTNQFVERSFILSAI